MSAARLPAAWVEPLEAFLADHAARGMAPGTIRQHRFYLLQLAQAFPDPWTVTGDDVARWIAGSGWAARTQRTARNHVRPFYEWAVDAGRLTRSPLPDLRRPHSARTEGAPADGWSAALEEFEVHLEATTRAQDTRTTYLRHVEWLAESAPAGPWDISSVQLATWLVSHSWSTETRRKVMVSLRVFYAWAIAQGRLEWAPTAGLGSSTQQKRGPEPMRLPEAWVSPVEDHVTACHARSLSEGTISLRKQYLGRLAQVAADPWAVTPKQLDTWLSDPDWRPQTKRSARAHVRGFYRWAVRAGHLEKSPAEELETVRVPRSLPRPTDMDALRAALAGADDRTRLMIMLASLAGLRRSEIARLHLNEVGEDHLVVIGKGGHHRLVPLLPELASELHAEISRRRRGEHGTGWSGSFTTVDGYLFPSDKDPDPLTAGHVGKIMARALPGKWTAHSLRHRFATDAYAEMRDLRAVQELLGHAKPETTAIYAAVPDGALKAAVHSAGARILGRPA